MAVSGNKSDVVVTKGFKTIYGIAPFKVVAINPSMDQLIDIGINAQKETEYVGDKTRLELWMQSQLNKTKTEGSADKSLEELDLQDQLINKCTIFISNAKKGKTDGSTFVWINNFGRITSVPAGQEPNASWFKNNGQHIACEGEVELIKFLRAWVNAGPSDEVYIDDWAALVNGNVKELRMILHDFKDNILRSMIEVRVTKEGKSYAGIYNGHHEPWNVTGLTNWMKEFTTLRQGQHISYQLTEYVPNLPTPTADEAPTAEDASDWK